MTTTVSPVSTESVPGDVLEALKRLRAPVVIGHVVPDADALGAMLATARAFADESCRPTVALPPGSLSKRLEFMPEWAEVPLANRDAFTAADGFVVCDTAKKSRANVGAELAQTDWSAGRPVVNIDHHGTNTQFGDVNWAVETVGSTCELVYYLLRAGARSIDDVTASLLYAGMLTDTLGFSLPTTTASALRACAALTEAGAKVGELGERLCRSLRKSEFDLLRIVYANTRIAAGGDLAYSSASYDEIHDTGCSAADIDDQINIPRSLGGVRLAILFTEGNRGKTRINFRGSGDLTVVDLAIRFGGGGHAQAAGAVLDCGLQEAMEQVVPKAVEHLES